MEMEKRSKRSSEDEIDRISELPESLLLHILSLLDMKEVVKTSLLSKKWEYTWTSIPTLTFIYYPDVIEKLRLFVMWVNKTLLQCQNNTVRKFHVRFWYMKEFVGDVDLWAKFVAQNNIQDLTLELPGFDSYKLPRSLCQNSSLSSLSLRLSNCTISLGVEICWTFLTSLSLASIKLDNDIMTKILSGTPKLQVLNISLCETGNGNVLHIYSNSLRELMIENFLNVSVIEISAPKIQYLDICGRILGKYRLCSSSLVRAELDFKFEYNDSEKEQCKTNFITFTENILSVVQLEVGFYFLESFLLLGNNNSLSSPFSRLTCLKLNGIMDKTDIVCIICLLKCSPNLEKLVVNKEYNYFYKSHNRNQSFVKLADEYWESKRRMEKFELPYLKTVKFNGFKEVDEFTSVLLKLLHENDVHLENMVIDLGDLPMIIMPNPCVA